MDEIIRFEQATKYFWEIEHNKKVTALKEINCSIRQGEFVCVIGPSGCGKTTLLSLLAGFDNPSCGKIFFKGKEIQGPSSQRILVFQETSLYPWLTISQNIEFGLGIQGHDRKQRKLKAGESLALMGLSQFEHFRPHQLSVGMKHRAELARSFSLNPEALLMDEPFCALDALSRNKLQDEFLKIWSQTNKTVVFVTHSMEEAVYLADRIIVMTPLPGRIKAALNVDIPRPRSRFGSAVRLFQEKVFSALAG